MSATHTITVEVDDDGDPWFVHFDCSGGPEDICHQWCAEGCEESCYGVPIRPWPHSEELVAQAPQAGHRWEPRPDHGEACRIVEWLDAVGWQDSGWMDEPDAGGEREVTASDLRPGRHLIEEEWNGDDYIWRYPAEAAVTDAGVTR